MQLNVCAAYLVSQPIGLLNPDQLEQFKTRYDFMDDDMPKFLFGTHYATMAYTLHWLIRVVRLYYM